jgi:hypothetical protein
MNKYIRFVELRNNQLIVYKTLKFHTRYTKNATHLITIIIPEANEIHECYCSSELTDTYFKKYFLNVGIDK